MKSVSLTSLITTPPRLASGQNWAVAHGAEDLPGDLPVGPDGTLRGQLLVASPALSDPNFARSVVLITEHGSDGAMGVVLNRPSEIEVDDVAPELAEVAAGEPVFIGGPVQPQGLVVLADFEDVSEAAWTIVADVGFVAAETDYADLPELVRRGRVYAGYSGWGAG